MKRILHYIRISLLALSLAGTVSCRDFLNLTDPESLSGGNFPETVDDIGLIVNSVYGVQHHWYFLGNYWAGYVMYCLDHTIDMAWHEYQDWIDVSAGEVKVGNTYVSDPWTGLSLGVYYANSALGEISKFRQTAGQSEMAALDNYEGECLFFRAFYWWHMLSLYGQPDMDGVGIPLVKSVPNSLESMYVVRETTGAAYEAIIGDLLAAEKLLTQTDPHRVTVWAVKAFLAKAYFFAGETALAKEYLEDCISNSGKSLVSFENYRMMYNGYDAYEYNSESFYEVGNTADPTGGAAYGAPNTGSTLSMYYCPFCINPSGDRIAMSYGNQYLHDRNLVRFGYTDPAPLSSAVLRSEDTVIDGKDTTLHWLDEAYMEKQEAYHKALGTDEYDYENWPDPRLFVCALQPFLDSVQMTIDGVKAYRKVAQVEFGKWWEMDPSTGNDPQTFYGWPVRKYNFLDGHLLNETKNVAGYNIYFIRLPDIYLMYAEILADEGQEARALEYVNKVHRRAYGYDPDQPSPVDYASLQDRTKTADPEDYLADKPLLYERWAEMFGEMRWWEDVRRLRIGKQEADYYKTVSGPGEGKTNIVWKDRNYAMPIPTSEFESNPSPGMVQTPGY